MPDNRDPKAIAAVACPRCGAAIGDDCTPLGMRSIHMERRRAWQALRGPMPESEAPTRVCSCSHARARHERTGAPERGACDRCECRAFVEVAR